MYSVADINNPNTDTSTSGKDTGIVPALCVDLNYKFKGTSWICDWGNGTQKKITFTSDTQCTIYTLVDGLTTNFNATSYTVSGMKTVKIAKPGKQTQKETATVDDSTSPHTLTYSDKMYVRQE